MCNEEKFIVFYIIVAIISYLSLMQYHQYNIESADLSRRIQSSYLRM